MVCAQKKKLELEIDRELLFHDGLHINSRPTAFPWLGFVSMVTKESVMSLQWPSRVNIRSPTSTLIFPPSPDCASLMWQRKAHFWYHVLQLMTLVSRSVCTLVFICWLWKFYSGLLAAGIRWLTCHWKSPESILQQPLWWICAALWEAVLHYYCLYYWGACWTKRASDQENLQSKGREGLTGQQLLFSMARWIDPNTAELRLCWWHSRCAESHTFFIKPIKIFTYIPTVYTSK